MTSQTTLNTLPPMARIYYPFHPYTGQSFKILQRACGKRNQATVELSPGKTLTVPLWMLQPDAAQLRIRANVSIPCTVLLEIVDLFKVNCSDLTLMSDALESLDGTIQL